MGHTEQVLSQNLWRCSRRLGVSLVQTASPTRLAALLEHPALRPHAMRLLTPNLAITDATPELTAALMQAGVTPVVWGPDPAAADHRVMVDESGLLRPTFHAPQFYLSARLNRIAAALPDGNWRITAESVGRFGRNRAETEALLAELRRLVRGDLPPKLEESIRGWGHYFGAATLEPVTLVAFDSVAILEELLQRPELQGLLQPFEAPGRALAVASQEALHELPSVLARLGLEVKGGNIEMAEPPRRRGRRPQAKP